MSFRGFVRVVRRTVYRLLALPGDFYAKLYIALRLNRVFHFFCFSGAAQIRLVPKRLFVSRRLMHQPYWVALTSIRWGGRPSGGELRKGDGLGRGMIFDGDWDIEDKRDIAVYLESYIYSKTVYQIFRDGMDFKKSDQYKEMSSILQSGQTTTWQARGCCTESDIRKYFSQMRETFVAIQDTGYKSQEQLGNNKWYDEIKIFVDRNGEFHKQQAAGHHRLAMARILGVAKFPVVVLGVHKDWAMKVQHEKGLDVISSIDQALQDRAP